MFDPTAFENMKVVLEGAIYDRDLDGAIHILDRNDYINSAKLSRKYEVVFSNEKATCGSSVKCRLTLEAGLENLAAELLPAVHSESSSGCHLIVSFSFMHKNEIELFQEINDVLKEIWGHDREIRQTITLNPFLEETWIKNKTTIKFNRLIKENHMDDLIIMIDHMIESIERIDLIIY